MATAVQIEVTVDESGVVTGVQNINGTLNNMGGGLQKVGQTGNVVMTGLTNQVERAHAAARLMEHTFGLAIPRALTTVIAKSELLGAALSAAFGFAVFAAAIPALMQIGEKLKDAYDWIGGMTSQMKDFEDATGKANAAIAAQARTLEEGRAKLSKNASSQTSLVTTQGALEAGRQSPLSVFGGVGPLTTFIAGEMQLREVNKDLLTQQQQGIELATKTAELNRARTTEDITAANKSRQAGLEGIALIEARRAGEEALLINEKQQWAAQGAELDISARMHAVEATAAAERLKIVRQLQEEADKMTATAKSVGLVGVDAINAKFQASIADIENKRSKLAGNDPAANAAFDQQDVAAALQQRNEILDMLRKFHLEATDMAHQADETDVQGAQLVTMKLKEEIRKRDLAFEQMYSGLDKDSAEFESAERSHQSEITSLTRTAAAERAKILQQYSDQTLDLENKAQIARLPEWQRADANIFEQERQQLQKLDELFKSGAMGTDADGWALYNRQRLAIFSDTDSQIQDENRRMVDSLANDLESMFSGNVLQNILAKFKHMFFQIAASWLMTLNGMQSGGSGGVMGGGTSSGGGGIFGSLLGSLFGIKSGGAGGTIQSTPPFVGNNAFDATMGSNSGSSGFFGAFPSAGDSMGGGTMGQMASIALGGGALSAGVGTAALAQSQQASGQVANTLGGSILQSLTSKIFTHGLSIGKFNISGGALGMAGAGIGLASILGAYSSGSKLMGVLGGAAGGALMGTSIGSSLFPGAGTVIGAAIGAIAGLISGWLGGNSRTAKAHAAATAAYTQLDATKAAYYDHQTDYASALSQIDQLQQATQQSLGQYGSQGNKVFNNEVVPRFTSTVAAINDIENQRQQRSLGNFQPTQFATGGLVTRSSGPAAANGAVLIAAHPGEYVVNPGSTAANLGALASINSGGSKGGGDLYLTVQAMDAKSFEQWLKDGAIRNLKRAWSSDSADYAGSMA